MDYKKYLVDCGMRMFKSGLTVETWGNISIKDPETGLIYLTYEKQPDSYVPHDYAALEVLAFEESKLSNPKKRYADQLRSLYADGYMRARMWETMGTEGEFS